MAAALDVSLHATDALSEEVGQGRSCTVETAVRQNTKAEPYPLWTCSHIVTDHFSGPGSAVDPLCVSVCSNFRTK